ncbi:MAG: hypothetical protein KBS79_03180 [Lachnospiraceae bacterium]|nr:hypothetical protein [Candidatus Minthocola equi]
MENKKYLPLKIIHLIFMVAGIVLFAISLISYSQSSALGIIGPVLNILALAAGIVYLAFGYKKDANLYYKIFMWALVISQIVEFTGQYSTGDIGTGDAVFNNLAKFVAFALIILLAGAKDYGVVKSNILSIALVVINTYIIFDCFFSAAPNFVAQGWPVLPLYFDAIGQFIIASTVAFMVCGKYLDKAARGTK